MLLGLGDIHPQVREATAIVRKVDQVTLREPPKIFTGSKSRPKYEVSKEHLEYLVQS